MPDSFPAAQTSLSFAKLVATPTETAWSQAYHAGNFFVCIGLTDRAPSEESSLQALGKDIFNTLQSEFFTLEEKNTAGIKQAITISLSQLPAEVSADLTLAFFKDSTLIIVIAGSGKVVIKRDEKIGVLLNTQNTTAEAIHSVSGFSKDGDTIVLQTGPFAEGITNKTLEQALDLSLPTDIVEALSPQIHEQENGAQAAIVITYRGTAIQPETTAVDEQPTENNEPTTAEQTLGALYEAEEQQSTPEISNEQQPKKPFSLPKFSLPKIAYFSHLSHRRKLFLNIALILVLLLVASIFLTLQKKNADQQHALFQQIYPQAKQDYETGQGLESLNPELSQKNYQKAEGVLKAGQTKFSKGSDEYKQIDALLSQVENSLHPDGTVQTTATKAVEPDKNSLLQVAETNKDGLAFGEDDTDVYVITAKAISTVSKSSGDKKELIKNDNDWSSPQAVVPYQGNVYVLDQKKGVIKFVQGSGGFGKSSYFKDTAPDLSQATGMGIDGSVWLVGKGGLLQYTKGVSTGLKVTGLEKPLSSPTKLVTDIAMEHVYILDNGNNRIVQFDKHGAYQNAYTTPILGQATDFTVSEKDKTIQVLSGGKVWQMSL